MHQHRDRHDLEDNLVSSGVLVLARIDAHRYTGSLDRGCRVVRLVLPPFHDFLQLFFQGVLFVLRKFQILQPFFVLCLSQRRGLVVHKPWIDRSREINKDEGSNDVEADGCPCNARPIGVEA